MSDNFQLIAINTTSFYSTLRRNFSSILPNEKSLLAVAGIFDAQEYILKRSITAQEVIRIAADAVNKGNSLFNFIIALEKLLFKIDIMVMNKESIDSAVESQSTKIKDTIDDTLSKCEEYSINEPGVMQFMQKKGVLENLKDLGLICMVGSMSSVAYAGFWKRLTAFVIDGFVLIVPMIAFAKIVHLLAFWLGYTISASKVLTIMCWLVAIGGPWLYCSLMESSVWQATLGKRVLGIVVVDTNGNRLTWGRATVRYFSKFISGFPFGYWVVLFTQKKQTIQDMIAGTCVVNG